jgi:hypothetical protein
MLRRTPRQWPILLLWICREKHIMRREWQAFNLSSKAHDMGRKTARITGLRGGGGAGRWSQKPAGQGIWIAIEQNRITRQKTVITFELIFARFPAFKPCDIAIITKFSA